MDKKLVEYAEHVFELVREQLKKDQERWGDTWKTRTREGQEDRAFSRYSDYYDQWKNAGTPIPWLKIIGEAIICIVRENERDGN